MNRKGNVLVELQSKVFKLVVDIHYDIDRAVNSSVVCEDAFQQAIWREAMAAGVEPSQGPFSSTRRYMILVKKQDVSLDEAIAKVKLWAGQVTEQEKGVGVKIKQIVVTAVSTDAHW